MIIKNIYSVWLYDLSLGNFREFVQQPYFLRIFTFEIIVKQNQRNGKVKLLNFLCLHHFILNMIKTEHKQSRYITLHYTVLFKNNKVNFSV